MQNKLRILHLSDLHLKVGDISQDIVIDSLSRKLTSLFRLDENKPDVLIVSGDIAFSGKQQEYEVALTLLENLRDSIFKESTKVYFVPGNHDVERAKILPAHLKWWYNFSDEQSLFEILRTDDSFSKMNEKFDNYYQFVNRATSEITAGKYGQYVFPLSGYSVNIKVVGLNSSIFCGYDGDDLRKLAFGLDQVNNCERTLEENDFVITIFHHPFDCYNYVDNPSINSIKRFSNVILTGHLHVPQSIETIGGNEGRTVYVSAGASYEKRTTQNSFNIIDIDFLEKKGTVLFYKYLVDSHIWIENRDLNFAANGEFKFALPEIAYKKLPSEELVDAQDISDLQEEESKYLYEAVISVSFSELKRQNVESTIGHIKNIVGDDNIKVISITRGSTVFRFVSTKNIASKISDITFEDGSIIKRITFINEVGEVEVSSESSNWLISLNQDFESKILNPGATFVHGRKDELKLADIWVAPNLREIEIESSKEKIKSSDEIFNVQSTDSLKFIVYGDDGSGKSSLIQWYFIQYYQRGFVPIIVPGNSIKEISVDALHKLVRKQFHLQYNTLTTNYSGIDPSKIIVFFEDFHRVRFLKPKFKEILLRNISRAFDKIVITGNNLMKMESMGSKSLFTGVLGDFRKFEIIEYGPSLRFEIIKKWNGIGIDRLDPNELIRLNNESETYIDSIIGKNFVPSYPLYLLTILQAREGLSGTNPDYSLHGFYYEHLINEALSNSVEVKDDISFYFNYITEYCYFIFSNKLNGTPLHILDFERFHIHYCEEYNVRIGSESVLRTFYKAKILSNSEDYISITYKYVYYFFVARYLSNNLGRDEIRAVISSMCQRVHRDEFASIILFLTHLSKDQFIINELLMNSRELFSEFKPVKLEDDVHFINDLVQKLPEHIYEPLDIEKVKNDELKEEEEFEAQEKEFVKERDVVNYDINEDITNLDALSKMIKAVKTMELIGQITKKYWGELKANQKYELAEETYLLGLRALNFNFNMLSTNIDAIEEYLTYIYKQKHKKLSFTKNDIDKASKDFVFNLSVMSSFGIIKKITQAIGYERLDDTFKELQQNHDTVSVNMIDVSIKLDYKSKFPWSELKSISEKTNKNFLSKSVLRNLVLNYLYVFHTTAEEKQKICSITDIKIEEQRYIDFSSKIKKG